MTACTFLPLLVFGPYAGHAGGPVRPAAAADRDADPAAAARGRGGDAHRDRGGQAVDALRHRRPHRMRQRAGWHRPPGLRDRSGGHRAARERGQPVRGRAEHLPGGRALGRRRAACHRWCRRRRRAAMPRPTCNRCSFCSGIGRSHAAARPAAARGRQGAARAAPGGPAVRLAEPAHPGVPVPRRRLGPAVQPGRARCRCWPPACSTSAAADTA